MIINSGEARGGGSTPTLQTKTKTYTPTTSQQTDTVTADNGYDGLSSVGITVNAMPSGTAGTPTATKGTVSNHSVSVTPKVTNTTGYITGSTKTGTAVTVSASELVSGTKSITSNGTGIDVTDYASVDVSVSGSGKNIQMNMERKEISNTTYVTTGLSLTVAKAGTYKVYWVMDRNTTSGTTGTRVYRGSTFVGTTHSTWTYNGNNRNGMNCEEEIVFSANDTVTIYARSRSTSYICGVSDLVIVEQ